MQERRAGAIFLDRDGVLNKQAAPHHYIQTPAALELLPGVPQALSRLQGAGWPLVVVTNQRGISRGMMSEADLADVHHKLNHELERVGVRLDAIYHCPHAAEDACPCRKPAPGMVLEAIEAGGFDPIKSYLIGDSQTDLLAAHRAKVPSIWITPPEAQLSRGFPGPVARFEDLVGAVDWILAQGD